MIINVVRAAPKLGAIPFPSLVDFGVNRIPIFPGEWR
jgi:hypothetical protein